MGVKMLKMAIFFKLIVESKKKTYISYVFMFLCKNSLKMASELKVLAIVL